MHFGKAAGARFVRLVAERGTEKVQDIFAASFPRKRESRGTEKAPAVLCCSSTSAGEVLLATLDSRLRGNDNFICSAPWSSTSAWARRCRGDRALSREHAM